LLSGTIRNQVGDDPTMVYNAREGFYEVPASHREISENASGEKEPASLLALLVVGSKDNA
jgi:hypothetical protein